MSPPVSSAAGHRAQLQRSLSWSAPHGHWTRYRYYRNKLDDPNDLRGSAVSAAAWATASKDMTSILRSHHQATLRSIHWSCASSRFGGEPTIARFALSAASSASWSDVSDSAHHRPRRFHQPECGTAFSNSLDGTG